MLIPLALLVGLVLIAYGGTTQVGEAISNEADVSGEVQVRCIRCGRPEPLRDHWFYCDCEAQDD